MLTYQAVASFGPAENGHDGYDGDAEPPPPGPVPAAGCPTVSSSPRCTRTASACWPRSRRPGQATLVLDECHHLLEMWGRLLLAIVAELPGLRIIGLTATPPHLMTADQAVLHRELFGSVDLEVSAPALVRDGHLAPYQELAWFTRPTPAEADYIGGQALRFAELRAGLLDPGFAGAPFLAWLQQRVVERQAAGTGARLSWEHFAQDQPPSPTPPCGCTATGCCRSPKAPPFASSTATRRPPRTGSR